MSIASCFPSSWEGEQQIATSVLSVSHHRPLAKLLRCLGWHSTLVGATRPCVQQPPIDPADQRPAGGQP